MKIKLKKIRKRRVEKLSVARTGRRVCRVSLWLTFLLVRVLTVDAQRADLPFSPGEELRYGAYYNWQFLWVNAGEVVFQTDTVRQNGQTEWLLEATGATYKAYDLFYTVRDTFRTLLTYPDFQPLHFYRAVNHGGHQSWQSYAFDRTARKISYVTRAKKSDPRQRELPLSTDVHDLLSQAYLFRKYNFDGLKKDEMIRFSMMTDEKPADFYFRYKGKEVVKTRNGRRFNCHKVSVWLMEGEFFPEGEDMLVWFTADKNHIPVMVETKIQIGAVKAIFLDANSLTYPLNSEIN